MTGQSHEQSHEQLVKSLRRAAESLTENRSIRDLEVTLDQLVRAAVETVEGAEGGGVSRIEHGTVRSCHATSRDIFELDQLQSQLGEGPCVMTADDRPEAGIVVAHDLAGPDAARWPRFAPAAVAAGYRSLMSIELSVTSGLRSALNLYAALETRDVIGQGKGILIERFSVDEDEAFQMLVRASQDTHVKLVEVARWLTREAIARGAVDGSRPPDGEPPTLRPD